MDNSVSLSKGASVKRVSLRAALRAFADKLRERQPPRLDLLDRRHVRLADEMMFQRPDQIADALMLAKNLERMNEALWNKRGF